MYRSYDRDARVFSLEFFPNFLCDEGIIDLRLQTVSEDDISVIISLELNVVLLRIGNNDVLIDFSGLFLPEMTVRWVSAGDCVIGDVELPTVEPGLGEDVGKGGVRLSEFSLQLVE